jgi:predicted polyphosphate/ATP-dependent NAD kinase
VGALGVIVNPVSGRDVRRRAARAGSQTPESKRNQVARAVVGAVAAGARRVVVVREPFRIATGAIEMLRLDAEIDVLELRRRRCGTRDAPP